MYWLLLVKYSKVSTMNFCNTGKFYSNILHISWIYQQEFTSLIPRDIISLNIIDLQGAFIS